MNGAGAHPLWVAMKGEPAGRASGLGALLGDSIKWNFSKMLLDKDGHVVGRFGSATTPEQLRAEVEKLLV